MNDNKNGGEKNDIASEVGSWIVIVIAFAVFWPVGFVLLFKKLGGLLGKTGGKTGGKTQGSGFQANREYEYPPEVNADAFRRARDDMASRNRRPNVRTVKKAADKAADKKKPQELAGIIPTALLVLGITLLCVGAAKLSGAFTTAAELGFGGAALWRLIQSAFYLAGGGASFLFRGRIRRRTRRQKQYTTMIGASRAVKLTELAEKTGTPVKTVRADLEDMIDDGAFGPQAYIDVGLDSLVISPEAAEEERQRRYAEDKAAETAAQPQSRYASVLSELRNLNVAIEDEVISEKISRIEGLTAKIFHVVEEKPEKLADIRKFMDYYLPTTLKLLRSYATLEQQGIEGDNIASAKADIGRILDTLATGYEQQLDQLFRADMMDISSDIDVLETMMEKDGLSGDNPFMQAGGGH